MDSPPINADVISSVGNSNVLNHQVKQFTFKMNGLHARRRHDEHPGARLKGCGSSASKGIRRAREIAPKLARKNFSKSLGIIRDQPLNSERRETFQVTDIIDGPDKDIEAVIPCMPQEIVGYQLLLRVD